MQEPEYTEHNYRKTSAVVSGAANFTEEDGREDGPAVTGVCRHVELGNAV